MPNEKVDRNKRLYQYYLDHPSMSIAAIGRVFKIKGEVSWRIIQKMKARAEPERLPKLNEPVHNAQPAPSSPVADQFHIEQESK